MESVDPTIDLPYRSLDLIGVALNGMVRDVASWQFSSVFGGNPLHAVPVIFASAAMVVFAEVGLIGFGMMVAPILGNGLAIIAYWFEWVLPRGINYALVN